MDEYITKMKQEYQALLQTKTYYEIKQVNEGGLDEYVMMLKLLYELETQEYEHAYFTLLEFKMKDYYENQRTNLLLREALDYFIVKS